jgi:hypothetical protein
MLAAIQSLQKAVKKLQVSFTCFNICQKRSTFQSSSTRQKNNSDFNTILSGLSLFIIFDYLFTLLINNKQLGNLFPTAER